MRPSPRRPLCRLVSTLGSAVVGLSLTMLGGCGGGHSTHGASEQGSSRADSFKPGVEPWAKIGYRWDWSGFPAVANGGTIRFFDVQGDALVAQDSSGVVTLMEPANGRVRWSAEVANPLTRFVGINRLKTDRADLVIVSGESEVYQLNAQTGTLVSRQSYERVVNTRPVMVGQLAIYGTSRGEVLAHHLGTGFKAWGFGTPGSIETSPVLVGGLVATVSSGGEFTFLEPSRGGLIGRGAIYAGIAADAVAGDDLLIAASTDQSLWGLSPSGRSVWRVRTSAPLRTSPVVHGGVVYAELPDRGFCAFDVGTGAERWVCKGVAGRLIGVRGGRLLVWDGREAVTIDPVRGSVIERASLDGVQAMVADAFEDGNLYVITRGGVVAKFLPRPM
ncbi:MAG: PQQ-binding-like beta-propeller repeat protein [Phycisphaerales bacterium]|nr:PQQ-binding-like beta-propeller repeat protein [Phycisphaerales bacterium]